MFKTCFDVRWIPVSDGSGDRQHPAGGDEYQAQGTQEIFLKKVKIYLRDLQNSDPNIFFVVYYHKLLLFDHLIDNLILRSNKVYYRCILD